MPQNISSTEQEQLQSLANQLVRIGHHTIGPVFEQLKKNPIALSAAVDSTVYPSKHGGLVDMMRSAATIQSPHAFDKIVAVIRDNPNLVESINKAITIALRVHNPELIHKIALDAIHRSLNSIYKALSLLRNELKSAEKTLSDLDTKYKEATRMFPGGENMREASSPKTPSIPDVVTENLRIANSSTIAIRTSIHQAGEQVQDARHEFEMAQKKLRRIKNSIRTSKLNIERLRDQLKNHPQPIAPATGGRSNLHGPHASAASGGTHRTRTEPGNLSIQRQQRGRAASRRPLAGASSSIPSTRIRRR